MSAYVANERRRAVLSRQNIFRDPGKGLFSGKERDFVLQNPALNLWAGIREDACDYFERNRVSWWGGANRLPTGHLLSSQVACVNHLYAVRQRPDAANVLLKAIDPNIERAIVIDDGLVEFEFIGSKPVLGEKAFTRGSQCTSVDAAMIGERSDGSRCLFLIEWKYTESYWSESKYIDRRARVYDQHIQAADGPIAVNQPEILYYEPFYQLMRQTLLGWLLVQSGDYGCSSYRHVHIAPKENLPLHSMVTSPGLLGEDIYKAWRGALREPSLFVTMSPSDWFGSLSGLPDISSLLAYLGRRYWPERERWPPSANSAG